jgi:hypothetical protein
MMTDDELKRAYAAALAGRQVDRRAGCPSPESLQALVERAGSESARLATLDHAMACPACLRDLELLRAVATAAASEGAAATPRRASWLSATPLRAAAALALLVVGATALFVVRGRERESRALRGPGEITLVAPIGTVRAAQAGTLIWRGSAGAVRYDVEVLTSTGDSVFATSVADTSVVAPGIVGTDAGRAYVWSVRAVMADGSQAAAASRRILVTP